MGPVAKVVLGAVIGGALAGAGLLFGGATSGETDQAVMSVSSITAPVVLPAQSNEPAWTEEGGVRYESTVIVVDGLDVTDGAAIIDYRLISLGESGELLGGGTQLPGVLPANWELVTRSGGVIEATSDPPPRNQFGVDSPSSADGVEDSIRFDGDQDLIRDDVIAVSVTAWRVALPLDMVVSMPGQKGASVRLHNGTVITLDTILEQRTGAILSFDLDQPPDRWRTTADQGFGLSTQYVGDGPGWQRAASTIGGIGLSGGATGFQLLWQDPTPPETVRIRIRTVEWQARDGNLVVWPTS